MTDHERGRAGSGANGTDDDPTGPSRRRLLRATASIVTLPAVAGCTGGGGSTGGDSSNETTPTESPTTGTSATTTDTPTETESATPTATTSTTTAADRDGAASIGPLCRVAKNSVDELTIVGCQSEVQDDSFVVTLRIRNDGNETADLWNYHLEINLYDSTETTFGNEISVPNIDTRYPGSLKVPPGETGRVRVTLHPASEAAPEKVEAYTITMECGPGRGVYCG